MKIKIVFCNHYARPNWLDGAEVSLFQIINALPTERFEKYLISPTQGVLTQLAENSGIPVEIAPISLIWSMGGLAQPTNVNSIRQHIKQVMAEEAGRIYHLKRFLRLIQPHFILINTSVNVIPAMIGKNMGIKTIWFPREYFRGRIQESFQLLNEFGDQIWVSSSAMFELLNQSHSLHSKLSKIPNFIDISNLEEPNWSQFREQFRRQYDLLPTQVAICFWSSISPKKGIFDFIQLASILKQRHGENIKFFVAGSTSNETYEQQALVKCKELHIENDLRFVGFFPHSQTVLPGMDIIVLPSYFMESFSRSALDAMVYQKPVVAYSGGGIGELVKHGLTGYLVPKGDIEGLSEYCSNLIVKPLLRQKLGNEARQLAEVNFSASKVIPQIINALH